MIEGAISVACSARICGGVGDVVEVRERDRVLHVLPGLVGDAEEDEEDGIGQLSVEFVHESIDAVDGLRCKGCVVVVLSMDINGKTSLRLEKFVLVFSRGEIGYRGTLESSDLPASVGSERVLGDTTIFELTVLLG